MLGLLPLLCGFGSSPFQVQVLEGRVSSLQYVGDRAGTDYVAKGAALGEVRVSYRKGDGAWSSPDAASRATDESGTGAHWRLGQDLGIHSWFESKGSRLLWRFRVSNVSSAPVEIGGLATPLPMRTRGGKDVKPTVFKHSFISGAGSFIFWMRPDSVGPYLTMVPLKRTSLEYWNRGADGTYQTYVHSASEVPVIEEHHGSWRLPHTSRKLRPGEAVEYGYAFEWARDYRAVRDLLARTGGLDVQVAPGMTVPNDLFADVAFRSTEPVSRIEAEFPRETEIRRQGSRGGYQVYRVRFRHPGENRLAVHQRDGGTTYLEFFSCLPIETLMAKRAAFIARSQVRDTSKWYDGLLREWNMRSGVYLDPDHYDLIKGWRIYEVTCDDPGLSKPAFLAAENAEHPRQDQVAALDRYVDKAR